MSASFVLLSRSVVLSFVLFLASFGKRERRRKKASNQLARFVHTLYSVIYLTRILYYYIKVDARIVCRSLSFEERERDESVLPRVFIPPPSCVVYVFVIEGRREKDSDGDDIGASNVATPTTKELALEEKRVWSESSSLFEQSDDDVWEDAVFACI